MPTSIVPEAGASNYAGVDMEFETALTAKFACLKPDLHCLLRFCINPLTVIKMETKMNSFLSVLLTGVHKKKTETNLFSIDQQSLPAQKVLYFTISHLSLLIV